MGLKTERNLNVLIVRDIANLAMIRNDKKYSQLKNLNELPPVNLKSVFYGIRTPSRHKKMLYNLIRNSDDYEHLIQYQIKRKPGELSIKPELLIKNDLEIDGDGKK